MTAGFAQDPIIFLWILYFGYIERFLEVYYIAVEVSDTFPLLNSFISLSFPFRKRMRTFAAHTIYNLTFFLILSLSVNVSFYYKCPGSIKPLHAIQNNIECVLREESMH